MPFVQKPVAAIIVFSWMCLAALNMRNFNAIATQRGCPISQSGLTSLIKKHESSVFQSLDEVRIQVEKETTLLKRINELQKMVDTQQSKLHGFKDELQYVRRQHADLEYTHEALVNSTMDGLDALHLEASAGAAEATNTVEPSDSSDIQTTEEEKAEEKARDIVLKHENKLDDAAEVLPSTGANVVVRKTAPQGIAVVVLAYNSSQGLSATLESLFRAHPADENFVFYVSQDGEEEEVTETITAAQATRTVVHLRHQQMTLLEESEPMPVRFEQSYRISSHLKWVLSQLFDVLGYDKVVVFEEDMVVSPDLLVYLSAASFVLDEDPTVYCVTGWSANGRPPIASVHSEVYRTDHFAGIGFMLGRDIWTELSTQWPAAFWRDWLNNANQRKERTCVYPEVSRVGLSAAPEAGDWLNGPPWTPAGDVSFTRAMLDYLVTAKYDAWWGPLLEEATLLHGLEGMNGMPSLVVETNATTFKVLYASDEDLHSMMAGVGMVGAAAGPAPGSYKGTVHFRWDGYRVLFTPQPVEKEADVVGSDAAAAAAAPEAVVPKAGQAVFIPGMIP